jgi:hypothetical protein
VADKDNRHRELLSRRVQRSQIELGRAYVIHARNGGVGVAVEEDGAIGYQLHRVKFGRHYLFVEIDWEDSDTFGTAIPLARIAEAPPDDEMERLAWLRKQELAHRTEIGEAWSIVLGRTWDWTPES